MGRSTDRPIAFGGPCWRRALPNGVKSDRIYPTARNSSRRRDRIWWLRPGGLAVLLSFPAMPLEPRCFDCLTQDGAPSAPGRFRYIANQFGDLGGKAFACLAVAAVVQTHHLPVDRYAVGQRVQQRARRV